MCFPAILIWNIHDVVDEAWIMNGSFQRESLTSSARWQTLHNCGQAGCVLVMICVIKSGNSVRYIDKHILAIADNCSTEPGESSGLKIFMCQGGKSGKIP